MVQAQKKKHAIECFLQTETRITHVQHTTNMIGISSLCEITISHGLPSDLGLDDCPIWHSSQIDCVD